MNLMRPGPLSQSAVMPRVEHISKAGRALSSSV